MIALVNLEAEQELIGNLLSENALFDMTADIIEPDDFSVPLHGRIYETALGEVMAGKSANPVTLKQMFADDQDMAASGGASYLLNLIGMAGFCNVREMATHIRDLSVRRFMQDGLTSAAGMCGDLNTQATDIIDEADHALAVRAKDRIHQPTGDECIDELLAGYAAQHLGVKCCQIPAVDDLLGPMRPKQLVIGAGRPGMGKTAFALSYAIGAAEAGHGVLFVSLEMSSAELAARMVSDMCFGRGDPLPFNAVRDGTLSAKQRNMIGDAKAHMRKLPFQVIDAGSLTVSRLGMLVRRHARRMAARGHKLELVVVDYLQLLSADGRGKSAYETVSEVSRGLKAMAKDNNLAVLALAQLSREVEKRPDKRPQLSDLRDSGQIEQDADAVLFLLRNEYYLRQCEPDAGDGKRLDWERLMADAEGKIEFILAKRRNGVTGSAVGSFHGAFQAVR